MALDQRDYMIEAARRRLGWSERSTPQRPFESGPQPLSDWAIVFAIFAAAVLVLLIARWVVS